MEKKKFSLLQWASLGILLIIGTVYLYMLGKIVLWKYGGGYVGSSINLRPFAFISTFSEMSFDVACKNILGNIALFIPLGIFLSMLLKKRPWFSVLCGMGVSIVFEIVQYINGWGASDIDDVLLNTFGTLIGAAIYLCILKRFDVKRSIPYMTILFLCVFGALGRLSLYMLAPNMLPADIVCENEEVLKGVDKESFDLSASCSALSGDRILFKKDTVYKNDEQSTAVKLNESAVTADTEYFIEYREIQYSPNGNVQKIFRKFQAADQTSVAAAIKENATGYASLWMDNANTVKRILFSIYNN